MIIVEGPDGVGKTTLVRRLSRDLGIEVFYRKPVEVPPNVKEYTYAGLGTAASGKGKPVIYDRWFFSELVYGTILRDGPCFTYPEQDYILHMIKAMSCPIIFCTAPMPTIKRNLKATDQLKGVDKNIKKIVEAYRYYTQFARQRRLNVISFDYTQFRSKHYLSLTDQLNQYLQLRKVRTWTA